LLSCDLPAALADEDRVMLQGLFGIEFVLAGGPEWQTNETAQGLPCLCRYHAESGSRFVKSRESLAGPEGQPAPRIVESAITATAGSFWLESLEGAEKFTCTWQGKTVCNAGTIMKLSRLPDVVVPDSLL